MAEFRERTTGEVKSKEHWQAAFRNMSLPKVWGSNVFNAMNIDPVLPGSPATTTQYQVSVRDGVIQDESGNWVYNNVAKDMFTDDAELGTKAEQEAAYQSNQDANTAAAHRETRNKLLADSDWTQMNDSPLSNEDKTAWSTYRQELRDVSDLDAWPNLSDEDWPVQP
jgi:hypothetical protein